MDAVSALVVLVFGVAAALGVVRGVDERAGLGFGVGRSSVEEASGARSALDASPWLPGVAPPPVVEPEPLLDRPRPPRRRRRLGAPVPVAPPEVFPEPLAEPSLPGSAAPSGFGAPSDGRRSAPMVAALSAATGLSWFIW
ncbi:MAG: hypothetical protein ABI595_04085 [Actinomycetota bacterium]